MNTSYDIKNLFDQIKYLLRLHFPIICWCGIKLNSFIHPLFSSKKFESHIPNICLKTIFFFKEILYCYETI